MREIFFFFNMQGTEDFPSDFQMFQSTCQTNTGAPLLCKKKLRTAGVRINIKGGSAFDAMEMNTLNKNEDIENEKKKL